MASATSVELIRGLQNIQAKHHGCVLSIGKFDGVHLGHQAVLSKLLSKAKELSLPAVVMVFEPQPEELFSPSTAPARLSTLRDKYTSLSELGVDALLCARFCQKFASQSPATFIKTWLIDKLGVKYLVVGDDFRFGADRAGNFDMLREYGEQNSFDVVSTQSFLLDNNRISSTAIRHALQEHDFATAEAMLGRPFVIQGKVIYGEQNGRTIGFPTANILLKRANSPVAGVVAVKVKIDQSVHHGVANVGKRPTLNGERMQLEVNIFDFSKAIYGQILEVEFVANIRDEKKFDNLKELQQQIKIDVEQAKQLLGDKTNG